MNWDAIAAVSEALGAIGVVATVVYLAFQIRQNTRSIQGSTEQGLMSLEMDLFGLLAQHASIYRRGSADIGNLTEDETSVYEQLVSAVMSQMYSAYVQYQRGLVPHSVWQTYLTEWEESYLELPGFQLTWTLLQKTYPEEFFRSLNQIGKRENGAD
jgi:hypothetical protein